MRPQRHHGRRARYWVVALVALALVTMTSPWSQPEAVACEQWECEDCLYSVSTQSCLKYIGSWYCECCTCRHTPL